MIQLNTQTLPVEEAAKVLGIGRTAAYAAARRDELPVVRIGGRVLVSKPALEKMLADAGRKEMDK
ncbi:MAG: helix-turn-helix domain-containing protein [Armatimonadota bacterium]|nr:helix-turn-helix domain-containing protein [bacterium]